MGSSKEKENSNWNQVLGWLLVVALMFLYFFHPVLFPPNKSDGEPEENKEIDKEKDDETYGNRNDETYGNRNDENHQKKDFQSNSNCNKTIYYSLGDVDDRFDIKRKNIIKSLKKAEKIWESEVKANLFEYNEISSFSIHFKFDNRQVVSKKLENIKEKIEGKKRRIQNISDPYEKRLKRHNKKKEELNERVERINNSGGASESVKQEIQKKKNRLKKEESKLKSIHEKLDRLNSQLSKLVESYNQKAESLDAESGKKKGFKQAEHFIDGKKEGINVFYFETVEELNVVLAHEFGHALGIGHVSNPESIMFERREKQNLVNPNLSDEDLKALKNLCDEIAI